MVIHQYDKRKKNDPTNARTKLAEYIAKGKELKKKAEEEEDDELIFTIEDLKELEEEEPKEEKKEEPKEVKKEEEKKDVYKEKYEALQKENESLKQNKVKEKPHKEVLADLIRSKLMASFQPPHK